MRATSKEMYDKIKATGLLSDMRLRVYEILCRHNYPHDRVEGMTAHELRYYAEMVFHYANSEHLPKRLSELERLGVIRTVGVRECRRTHNRAIAWAITGNMPIKIEALTSRRVQKQEIALEKLRMIWETTNKGYAVPNDHWIEVSDAIKEI